MLTFGICVLVTLVMTVLLIAYRNLREDELGRREEEDRMMEAYYGGDWWLQWRDMYGEEPMSRISRLKTFHRDVWMEIKGFLAWLTDI